MVGMDAGTIEMGERQGMMIERIERWGERLLIAEVPSRFADIDSINITTTLG